MKKLLLTTISVTLLAGCSTGRDVNGYVNGTGESISGNATGFMDRSGKVTLNLSSGATCEGRVNKNSGGSKGRLDCTDGRGGPITLITSRTGGHGFGTLNGQEFKFTYGSFN